MIDEKKNEMRILLGMRGMSLVLRRNNASSNYMRESRDGIMGPAQRNSPFNWPF